MYDDDFMDEMLLNPDLYGLDDDEDDVEKDEEDDEDGDEDDEVNSKFGK